MMMNKNFYNRTKRAMDVVLSAIGLIVLVPLLIVTALLICITMGKPVLFRQKRLGLNAKPFTIYKFRTMIEVFGYDGNSLPDGERLTKLGRFFRITSIDELPELWNVLKGDMSLVGPRPLFVEYLPYYTEKERKRHNVRPGITGLAQINGRSFLQWEDRLKMDVQYVEMISLRLDVKILLKTALQVLLRRNVAVIPSAIGTTLIKHRSIDMNSRIEKGDSK